MKLDKHVVDMFTELTKPADDVKMEKTCYGTISVVDGTRYVKLDGSDLLVPAASTVKTSHGDRVTVLMKNHSLTVTGNLTAPATDGEGGSSGEAGTAATIEVGTVTTGEAGSSASVINSGTTSAAVFDFVIPRGDKGEKGDTGPQGPQGEKGDTGTWDGTIPEHEHTISDITDLPDFSQIINLGHTSTDTKSALGIQYQTTTYWCFNWTDYPAGMYDGQGMMIAAHYNSYGTTVGVDKVWCRQIFISPHPNTKIYQRILADSDVGEWTSISDGGNADTVDGKHADEFLYADGFAGQLAKLFSQPANDDKLATVFSVAPDDATLDTLNPGIYVVNTSAARRSLKIPNELSAGGPGGSTIDNVQCVGGILIKLGSVLGKPGIYADISGHAKDRPFTTSCAFFISNKGSIYWALEAIRQATKPTGEPYIDTIWTWKAFVFNSFSDANAYSIQSIKYIDSDVTLAPGGTYVMYPTAFQFTLPYTSGTAYGPTKSFPLKSSSTNPNLCIVNTSRTKNLIIPAGRYLIHAK